MFKKKIQTKNIQNFTFYSSKTEIWASTSHCFWPSKKTQVYALHDQLRLLKKCLHKTARVIKHEQQASSLETNWQVLKFQYDTFIAHLQ